MKLKLIIPLLFLGITIHAQEIVLECGQNSGTNFNGWYVFPYTTIDAIEFDEQSVSFFVEDGGDYTVTLQKEVEQLESVSNFSLLFSFEVMHHCILNYVTYFVSKDGRDWLPIQDSGNNRVSAIENDDYRFIKAEASIRFFDNGKMNCNYVKIEDTDIPSPEISMKEKLEESEETDFYIFHFEHKLNIETQSDQPYEVMITALSGQIVFRETYLGSERIDLPMNYTGLFIVTIIHNNTFSASKKIAL